MWEDQVYRPYSGNVQGWFQGDRQPLGQSKVKVGGRGRQEGQKDREGQITKKQWAVKSIIRF